MRNRKFGNTDLIVSEIGFGAWAIGGGAMVGDTAIGWGNADDEVSVKAIHAALDSGINFFDTADIYGLGHSESILGKCIGKNKEVVIATKVGNVSRENKFTVDYSKDYIIQACENSLKRLNRDVIEYYQLHTARQTHLLQGECIDAMQQLQKEGKIRYWGLSLNTYEPLAEAEYLMNKNYGNGFQLVLNLLNQRALPLLKKASDYGYGIIARMPLQFGLLTGKFDSNFLFPENDHRNKRLTPELIKTCTIALEPVWKLCEKYNCNKTALALSYILSYSSVSTVIPGIRTPEQVQNNTTGLLKLEANDVLLIENLFNSDFNDIVNLMGKIG